MAKLVVNPGSPVAWEIQLKPGANSIGRGLANDFKIADPSVSTSHCQIDVSEQGTVVRDLGSTNGTFINRTPVKEAALQPGQTLHLGGVELLFQGEGVAAAPAVGAAPVGIVLGTGQMEPAGRIQTAPVIAAPPPPTVSLGIARPVAGGATPIAIAPRPVAMAARPVAAVPVQAAAPALPPPAAFEGGLAVDAGQSTCKFHPKTPARFLCNSCHHYFCDLCVTSRTVGNTQQKFCRSCGNQCVPVRAQAAKPRSSRGFFPLLPGVFVYPFKGAGFFILVLSTVVLWALEFISAGMLSIFTKIVAIGYLFSFMQNIIHSTASDEEQLPGLPGLDDVGGGFVRLVGCVLMSFGIAIGFACWAFFGHEPMAGIAILPAVILGCFYCPMALLAVAMKDSVMASNPLVVIPAIFKVPLEYFITVVLLGAVVAMRWGGELLLVTIFGENGLTTHDMGVLFALLGARAFWTFTSVYLLTVNMRILGLLYVTKKQKLGWFSR